MLEIYIEASRTFNLKHAVMESIETGAYDTLEEDIRDCFTENQVEQVEEVLESGDIEEFIDDLISEWGADDADELLELMETLFIEANIQLHFDEKESIEESEEIDIGVPSDDDDLAELDDEEL